MHGDHDLKKDAVQRKVTAGGFWPVGKNGKTRKE
jgi:hypothetical protein